MINKIFNFEILGKFFLTLNIKFTDKLVEREELYLKIFLTSVYGRTDGRVC